VARAPLVLIVSQHEWASRSLDSVITPRGYAVLRAYNAEQALERAERNDPDAVFIDMSLPDMAGTELCRALLDRDVVSRSAPLLLIASSPLARQQKLDALEAGAWEILTLPLDAEELLLRIERYVRGKLESDRLQEGALIDAITGLYSWHGISRRIGEIAAAAQRYGRPLSCIVMAIGDDANGDQAEPPPPDQLSRIADTLRRTVRTSDILARIGPNEFAIVAPDTPPQGAQVLARRLRQLSTEPGSAFRAGVYAVDDLNRAQLDPIELVLRATRASHQNREN
jgi:two-component system cell cycle response regulator